MHRSPLVPELSVRDLQHSRRFYVDGIGFTVAYARSAPDFLYLDLNGAQLMLEEDHDDGWMTGSDAAARGTGMNLQIEVPDIERSVAGLTSLRVQAFRPLATVTYETVDGPLTQREYLAQDPDGYLIRLIQRQ